MFTDHIPKGQIDIINFTILEPVTSLSNILLFGLAFIFSVKLFLNKRDYLSACFFLFLSLSAFGGIFTHALYNYLSEPIYIVIWMLINTSMNTALLFLELSILNKVNLPTNKLIWRIFVVIKMLLGVFVLFFMKDLWATKLSVGLGLFIILYLFYLNRSHFRFYKNIFYGVALVLLGGVVQSLKINVHELWYNFNDIAHTIFIAAYFFIFKGFNLFRKS